MSDDDWRVKVTYDESTHGAELESALRAGKIDPDLIGHGVIVSNESHENELFLYAGTRDFAERAQQAVQTAADTLQVNFATELAHWHPVAEAWETPDAPMPDSASAVAAERAEVDASEDADSAALGRSALEVSIELPSRHAAIELAEQLTGEGVENTRRFRLLVLGASDEDAAAALVDRIRPQLPAGATISTAASLEEAERVADEAPVSFWRLFSRNEPDTL